ncbi:MAG: VOC family protein [Geodermatophilaceae bacterium]
MTLRMQAISVDSQDPSETALFWERALGWRRTDEDEDEVVLEPPAGSPQDGVAPDLLFAAGARGQGGEEPAAPRPAPGR